jgi:hypothetical protein
MDRDVWGKADSLYFSRRKCRLMPPKLLPSLRAAVSPERISPAKGKLLRAHNLGMNEGKRFCPKCRAWTMEPAEGILMTEEELMRVEPRPPAFEGRLTPYQCPICSQVGYEPVV